MKSNTFNTIYDAYQLVEGAMIRAKKYPEEVFIMDGYDSYKRGYKLFPFDNGVKFDDFGVIVTEKELKNDYEIMHDVNAAKQKIAA
jgi:hypothetical protein